MKTLARSSKKTTTTTKRGRRALPAAAVRKAKRAAPKPITSSAREPKTAVSVPATPKPAETTEELRERVRRVKMPMSLADAAEMTDVLRAEGSRLIPPATPRANPLAQKDTYWDHAGDVRPELTDLQILRAMFTTPNGGQLDSSNPTAALLADMLLCSADDAYMVNQLNDELDNGDVVGRVLMRIQFRASLAIEIARRAEESVRS